MAMEIIKDALVTLASVNLGCLVDFYTQLLAQNPTVTIPNVYAEFQISGLRLGIFHPQKLHASEFETSAKSKVSLCLEVRSLEEAIAHLTILGCPPPGEISLTSHGREVYAYDPDGNRLILHQGNGE